MSFKVIKNESQVKWIDYRKHVKWAVVYDREELVRLFRGKESFAFDTETTGLDHDKSKIVGFSFSFDGKMGYYVPLLHRVGRNAGRDSLDYVVDMIKQKAVYMFNKKYDLNMLEVSEGYDLGDCLNVFDVMILLFLRDTDWGMPSLKDLSLHYLGIEQLKLGDVMGGGRFDMVDVELASEYAALDAVCTYRLFVDTVKKFRDLKTVFKIDNLSAEVLRRVENSDIPLDGDFLVREHSKVVAVVSKYKRDIYDRVGYEFNINSGIQLAEALLYCGVELTEKTEKGLWKTSIDVLKRLGGSLPEMLIKYSEEVNYLGSYVKPLLLASKMGGDVRFNYNVVKAPTGRVASGSDKKNSYYAHYNIQSTTKAKDEEVYLLEDAESVTGWSIVDDIPVGVDYYVCESGADNRCVRRAFVADEGGVYVSMDYKSEELRIAANMSGESVWVDAFRAGKDVYAETARVLFGDDFDKNDRKKAKVIVLATMYGASERTLSTRMGVSLGEAKSYLEKYNRSLRGLFRWKSYVKRRAVKSDVFSYFGRPRRMSKFFNVKASGARRSFGYRVAVNSTVQSTASDILRLSLGRIYKWQLKNVELGKKFRILSTVHDEINFSVDRDYLLDFVGVVSKLMTFKMPGWELDLPVDVSVGSSWGRLVSYKVKGGRLIPDGKFVSV